MRTSRQTTSDAEAASGFTLIELMVVVAIITMIAIFAIPSISSYFQISINSAARQMATTVKEAYNATVLTGRVYRMAYDLTNNAYWVESGPTTVLLDSTSSAAREERRKRNTRPSDEKPAASPFSMDKTITRKSESLPRGVKFEDVITQQSKDPLTDGMAYTHIFPHGMTEQTMIHLKDGQNHHFTLVISPLIGRSDLYSRYVTREEVFGK